METPAESRQGATRRINALAALSPLFVAFVGFSALSLTSSWGRGTVFEAATITLLLGFGPLAGEVADAFRPLQKSGVVALGALAWLVVALLVWKTRLGNAHWILYAAATFVWLVVGMFVLAYKGLEV